MLPNKHKYVKCSCTGLAKKPLIATPGCSDDFAAVSTLPDEWTPRHCGPILTNYLREQKQDHDMVNKDLAAQAVIANKKVDNKVRTLAENLLCEIKENDNKIECVISKFKQSGKPLTLEDRNEALKQITQFYNERIQDLVLFKQEGIGLERERSDGLRVVLQNNFHRLIAIGHKTPKDLLHEFDEKIYEINQQLLSNNRAYIELEAQLRAQLDERIVSARSSLNQICISSSKIFRTRSALPWARNADRQPRTTKINEKGFNTNDVTTGVIFDLEEFKKCVSRIVEAYRGAILNVFSRFIGQLDKLHKNIGIDTTFSPKWDSNDDLKNMIDKALICISESSSQCNNLSYQDLEGMAREDIMNMQKSLIALGERLKDTYTILYNAGHLWDAHIMRSALVQKLTLAAVEDTQMVHDAIQLVNEVNFNIVLDQLRCASDADRLQQNYEIAVNLLDRTMGIYQQHSEIEISKLEDFMNLLPILSKILLSECDCLLEKHPKLNMSSSASLESPASINSQQMFSLRAPLPRAIFQTQLQEAALNNWRNGFLESFLNNLSAIPAELARHARKWVDYKCLQVNMRNSMKLVSHSIRAERVRASRDARLAEIKLHETRLNSHTEAIYALIDRITKEASEFSNVDDPNLYPLSSWMKVIETDINELLSREPLDPELKRLKMSSYAPRLIKHKEHFEKSLEGALQKYKKEVESKIQVIRISNFRFMQQLKLFIEGGRYSASEAVKSCGALVKTADSLESCLHRVMDVLNHRRIQILNLADQLISPLQRAVDEVLKYGTKTAMDKKKPPNSKRK